MLSAFPFSIALFCPVHVLQATGTHLVTSQLTTKFLKNLPKWCKPLYHAFSSVRGEVMWKGSLLSMVIQYLYIQTNVPSTKAFKTSTLHQFMDVIFAFKPLSHLSKTFYCSTEIIRTTKIKKGL